MRDEDMFYRIIEDDMDRDLLDYCMEFGDKTFYEILNDFFEETYEDFLEDDEYYYE